MHRHAALLYGALCVLLTSLTLFTLNCEANNMLAWKSYILTTGEIALIMIPYWWLRGRWRAAVLLPVWIIPLFCFANTLYLRAFGTLIPFGLMKTAGDIHPLVISSSLALLKPYDVVFIIAPLSLTLFLTAASWRRAIFASKIRLSATILLTVISLLMYAVSVLGYTTRYARSQGSHSLERYKKEVASAFEYTLFNLNSSHVYKFINAGLIPYCYIEFQLLRHLANIHLNTPEAKSLSSFADSHPDAMPMVENRRHNLVFVLVESLDAKVINLRFNDREVTPVLNALCADSNSVACTAVHSQIKLGTSADGQLMYNLGVTPCFDTLSNFFIPGRKSLPTLASLLPKEYTSAAIFDDDGTGWDKNNTYRAYAYDSLYLENDYAHLASEPISKDGKIMKYGLEVARRLPQPFYLQMLTIQMHFPANYLSIQPALDFSDTDVSELRQRYYNSTADFDHHLGLLIDGLKEAGLWENTILVVASDHYFVEQDKKDKPKDDIVFVAANAGTSLHVGKAEQVDVFPTLLDLMGVESRWRGVGRSMLLPDSLRAVDEERQLTASDSMIRSDFFEMIHYAD